MATHDSSFNFKVDTSGAGNQSTDAKSISDGQHIIVLVWNFATVPASGSITYTKDGGSAVSAGAPVQIKSASGNNDRTAAFLIRNPGAGSYVINSVSLPYLGLSAHVFNAKENFWIRGSDGAAGEGTGTTFTSGSVTPRFSSSVAFGYWTHNSHAGSAAMTVPGGWTLAVGPDTNPHKAENYGGASQPGGCAYRNITDSEDVKTPITFAPTCSDNNNYISLLIMISEPDTEYVIAGGTDGRCFFGNQALGGAISAPVVFDFTQPETGWISTPLPAGQGVVIFQTRYNQTPSDAAEWSAGGSGNTVLFADDAQRAHNSSGGNDNSVNYFYFKTVSACPDVTYDASGLPAGDDGRYGQIVIHVTEQPAESFYTATGAVNTQTSTATINFGSLTLPTTRSWVMKGAGTRGHAVDLCPVTQSPTTALARLSHPYFNTIPSPGVDYPAAFQNSIISSGPCTSEVDESGGTRTGDTWTMSAATANVGSVHTAFNLAGGTTGGGDETLAAGANGITVTAPSATIVPGATTVSAGANGLTVTAPSASILPGTVTLSAGANGISVIAPLALIAGVDQVLEASANGIILTAPIATLIAGAAPGGVEPSMLRRGDGFTPGVQRRAF